MRQKMRIQIQAKGNTWLVFIILFSYSSVLYGQYENKFTAFSGNEVIVKTQSYDGALLCIAQNRFAFGKPSYVFKYSMEGKLLWQKQLNNLLDLHSLINTQDSGFAISATVNMYPSLPLKDTVGDIAVLKFTKCGKLEWARYVPFPDVNQGLNLAENSQGEIFVCAQGINGDHDITEKPISILKFSSSGTLLEYASIEGISSDLFIDSNDMLYVTQLVYLPLTKTDTTNLYIFSGLKKLDRQLATVGKTVIGFSQKQLNAPGTVVFRKNNVVDITTARYATKNYTGAMFTRFDTSSFTVTGSSTFDLDNTHYTNPLFGTNFGDTIITSNELAEPLHVSDSMYTSIRLYNSDLRLTKEVKLNTNWQQTPNTIVQLQGNVQFVAGINNFSRTGGPDLSSIFLFDRQLNQQIWPTSPPSKGYDWACTATVPNKENINIDTVVIPVHVLRDTTRPDFSWLYASIFEPDQQSIGRKIGGWLVWPQPVQNGKSISLRAPVGQHAQKQRPLHVRFYDLQGHEVYACSATPEGVEQWHIAVLKVPVPGLYTISLTDAVNTEVGIIRIIIQ